MIQIWIWAVIAGLGLVSQVVLLVLALQGMAAVARVSLAYLLARTRALNASARILAFAIALVLAVFHPPGIVGWAIVAFATCFMATGIFDLTMQLRARAVVREETIDLGEDDVATLLRRLLRAWRNERRRSV